MTRPASQLPPAATCPYALRLADGRYVSDPAGAAASCSIDNAYLWLWPISDTTEERAKRVAAVVKRHPWIGQAAAVRSRA